MLDTLADTDLRWMRRLISDMILQFIRSMCNPLQAQISGKPHRLQDQTPDYHEAYMCAQPRRPHVSLQYSHAAFAPMEQLQITAGRVPIGR